VERVKGIEPSYAAWEAAVLPLNYTRAARFVTREGPVFRRADERLTVAPFIPSAIGRAINRSLGVPDRRQASEGTQGWDVAQHHYAPLRLDAETA
jgi:hypothetical protein